MRRTVCAELTARRDNREIGRRHPATAKHILTRYRDLAVADCGQFMRAGHSPTRARAWTLTRVSDKRG